MSHAELDGDAGSLFRGAARLVWWYRKVSLRGAESWLNGGLGRNHKREVAGGILRHTSLGYPKASNRRFRAR